MDIPKKIAICPIVDSVVEIRFTGKIFPNAVFGLIYNSLQGDFPKVEKLPILQLPEQLRDSDPNFKYKAHYRIISNDGYSVQVGPEVLVMGSPIPYPGWNNYNKKIQLVLDRVFSLNIIEQVVRLGVRFINFFDEDIYENINLNISINDESHTPNNTQLRTVIEKNGFHNTLNIANNASQTTSNNNRRSGSIIDIDTFKDYQNMDFVPIYNEEIKTAHDTEKEIFFKLLKFDFLNSLKPSYT